MLMGTIVLGIYVLPSVTAKFAGSHTMEANTTGGVTEVQCGNCHQYIQDELNLSDGSLSDDVVTAHITALQDTNYANASNQSAPLKMDAITDADITTVCHLCHKVQSGVSGGHTQVTIRACTDSACHGYNSSASPLYSSKLNITEKLGSPYDAHNVWYNAMTSASPYKADDVDGWAGDLVNQTAVSGGNYTIAFYTCLGCHTHVGIEFSPINRWNAYSINVSFNNQGAATVEFINMTSTNTTYASKSHGSVWR
jgi:cytochrome c2